MLLILFLKTQQSQRFKYVKIQFYCVGQFKYRLINHTYGGVDGSLHLTVPSMNRLNQTDPATFSILLFRTFLRGSNFLNFKVTSALFVPVKKLSRQGPVRHQGVVLKYQCQSLPSYAVPLPVLDFNAVLQYQYQYFYLRIN
jgi:hypothetical protein